MNREAVRISWPTLGCDEQTLDCLSVALCVCMHARVGNARTHVCVRTFSSVYSQVLLVILMPPSNMWATWKDPLTLIMSGLIYLVNKNCFEKEMQKQINCDREIGLIGNPCTEMRKTVCNQLMSTVLCTDHMWPGRGYSSTLSTYTTHKNARQLSVDTERGKCDPDHTLVFLVKVVSVCAGGTSL